MLLLKLKHLNSEEDHLRTSALSALILRCYSQQADTQMRYNHRRGLIF